MRNESIRKINIKPIMSRIIGVPLDSGSALFQALGKLLRAFKKTELIITGGGDEHAG